MNKECWTCKEEKPLNDFGKLKSSKDGYRNNCKKCRKEEYLKNKEKNIQRSRKRYHEKRDEILLKNAVYRRSNEKYFKGYSKIYYQENRETIKKRVNDYYHENKQKIAPKMAVYRAKWNSSEHGKSLKRFYSKRRNELISKLDYTLTIEEWEQSKNYFGQSCAYCGNKDLELQKDHVIPVTKGGAYKKTKYSSSLFYLQ